MSVTQRELELIRAEQVKFMDSRIRVERDTYAGTGEGAPAPSDVYTDLPASISAGFGFFREVADRMTGITAYNISVPYGSVIKVNDRIYDEAEVEYKVRDVRDGSSWGTTVQVLGDRVS